MTDALESTDEKRQRSFTDRVFRDPETGRLAIVQAPNAPLWIFIVTTAARMLVHPTGAAGTAVSVIGAVALLWWAVEEIGWGSSLFRRILGGVVLLGLAATWTTRLF
jgi:hypothetical protein